MNHDEFAAQAQRLAEERKLKCDCGNEDWRQFLYVSAGEMMLAGCKRCGAAYTTAQADTGWKQMTKGING